MQVNLYPLAVRASGIVYPIPVNLNDYLPQQHDTLVYIAYWGGFVFHAIL